MLTSLPAANIYRILMARPAACDPFDRHVLACVLATGLTELDRPLSVALGLGPEQIVQIIARYFEGAEVSDAVACVGEAAGEDEIEEADFRALLLQHRTAGRIEEEWLAAVVVRRSLRPGHLWRSLGLSNRSELSAMLLRHFQPLAARNVNNMRWKKFFYREMCQADGLFLCKSPVCGTCPDFAHCFGAED